MIGLLANLSINEGTCGERAPCPAASAGTPGAVRRSEAKLVSNLPAFDGHIERFLGTMPRFKGWPVEKVAIAPRLGRASREAARVRGYITQDLVDLTRGLQPGSPAL